jgi:hypothetical protein
MVDLEVSIEHIEPYEGGSYTQPYTVLESHCSCDEVCVCVLQYTVSFFDMLRPENKVETRASCGHVDKETLLVIAFRIL